MASSSQPAVTDPIAPTAESTLPPVSAKILAAYRRMAREPDIFAEYTDGTWVAFSGDLIVAAGLSLPEVIRTAHEAGESDPFILVVDDEPFPRAW